MKIPVIDLELNRPTRASLAFYSGLAAMAVAELIEWPLAVAVAAGHMIAENSRSETVSGAAEGVQSGAG